MAEKWTDLFAALERGAIAPDDTGFIVSARFHGETKYAIFEFTPLRSVKNLVRSADEQGLNYTVEGERIILLYEPADFPEKFMEPYLREPADQIPLRFNEMEIVALPNGDRVLLNREPHFSTGAVLLQKPQDGNFSLYVPDGGRLQERMHEFVDESLREDFRTPARERNRVLERFDRQIARLHATTSGPGDD